MSVKSALILPPNSNYFWGHSFFFSGFYFSKWETLLAPTAHRSAHRSLHKHRWSLDMMITVETEYRIHLQTETDLLRWARLSQWSNYNYGPTNSCKWDEITPITEVIYHYKHIKITVKGHHCRKNMLCTITYSIVEGWQTNSQTNHGSSRYGYCLMVRPPLYMKENAIMLSN
jgi:hypothetical protein